jgi:hypothetical protein
MRLLKNLYRATFACLRMHGRRGNHLQKISLYMVAILSELLLKGRAELKLGRVHGDF